MSDSERSGADRDPLVSVEGLRTYYASERLIGGKPVKAVDDVSFEIGRGETLGIVGESGCGKTTLGRSVLRLEDVDAGRVYFDGRDVTELGRRELKSWRQDAQMVYQNPNTAVNERMTVGQIVREPLDVHGWGTDADRRDRVAELLETVGLEAEHYHRYPHQFSGGQRQRIGIARALAPEPEFIVLDEPVSALDVSVQAKILNLLTDLQEELNLTYMLIAHDLSVVRHVCDRVGVMYLGKLMELGPTEELFRSPSNPYTRALLSAIPHADPTVSQDRITLRGSPPSPRDPPTGCGFSTRCPFKIRPTEHEAVDEEGWTRIEEFRAVLRDRARDADGFVDGLKRRLGVDDRATPIREVRDDLFDDVSLPEAAREGIDRAVATAAEEGVTEATELLDDAFGSVCETEVPDDHPTAAGRLSRCHRHRDEYEEPDEYRTDTR
ncbi:ABC transporter ATP-binding protein [Halorubrum sp. RMP-47]|uniref:ABC transporter ATP-binding protein n=1 Tax=Halorubrum miltondacostae TaxID=3076378 RepID=A0ABD5M6G4_9EURY